MIGRKFIISGMTLEVVSEDDEKWELRNSTTGDTVFIKKTELDKAIRLGKAEEITR